MANANVVADSFGGGSGARPTPPDYYSTVAQMKPKQQEPKKDTSSDEVEKALQAVFEVFKKIEARMGGKADPNLDAAKDALKKFYAQNLKKDPSALEGEKPAPPPDGATPPPAAA